MAAPMENCTAVGTDYFDNAPVRFVSKVKVRATRAQVFACLEDADAWPQWAPAITKVTWTSPKPFNIGTTRTVEMVGGMVADEEFIAWEPDRRMGFYFTRANMPAESFAEDYLLTDLPDGRVEVKWTMGMTMKGASRYTIKLFWPMMAGMNRWMLGRFGKHVEKHYT